MEYIDGVYRDVASTVNEDAFQLLNVKRRTFRTYRPIAEASFRLLSTHLHDTNSEAKKVLQRSANKTKLRDFSGV